MRRRVHLCGPFKTYHDGPIEVEASTVWDAVEAVTSQVKGFSPDPIRGRQRIQVVGFDTIESLRSESDVVDIYVMPAMTFGKNGGLVQTIIGVTLIVASFFIGGPAWIANAVLMTGISMTVGGLIQLLTPQPKNNPQNQSKYLAVNQNTVQIGTPIPLLYGEYLVGGQILSLQIVAKAQPTS